MQNETNNNTTPMTTDKTTRQIESFGPKVTLENTTIRKFQNMMRKLHGFYLNSPEPCNYGPYSKTGNWGAYDSTGQYWQVDPYASDYDEMSYVRSNVRRKIWSEIAAKHGYELTDA